MTDNTFRKAEADCAAAVKTAHARLQTYLDALLTLRDTDYETFLDADYAASRYAVRRTLKSLQELLDALNGVTAITKANVVVVEEPTPFNHDERFHRGHFG